MLNNDKHALSRQRHHWNATQELKIRSWCFKMTYSFLGPNSASILGESQWPAQQRIRCSKTVNRTLAFEVPQQEPRRKQHFVGSNKPIRHNDENLRLHREGFLLSPFPLPSFFWYAFVCFKKKSLEILSYNAQTYNLISLVALGSFGKLFKDSLHCVVQGLQAK